jgi:4-hydroxy-3-methylbut-2-enyl diphosphate reductase
MVRMSINFDPGRGLLFFSSALQCKVDEDHMQVKRADAMGMCFGVRDALSAIEQVADPSVVTIHGELVHNGEVLQLLESRGFHQSHEDSRQVPATPQVLITAHGVSNRERQKLRGAGKTLIDTTCPLVHKAHDAAQLLQADGRRVIVIGRPDHVEVRGIVEDLDDAVVVQSVQNVVRWSERRIGVVCQTTTPSERVDEIMLAIRRENGHADIRLIDTVCNPTKARGAALEALMPQIDALVVVGGRESNNTRQLVVRGQQRGIATVHIENEGELDPDWFDGRQVVGLTAGTSTLPATIDAVYERLIGLAAGVLPSSP